MSDTEPKPKINTVKQLEKAAEPSAPDKDEVLERIRKRLGRQLMLKRAREKS